MSTMIRFRAGQAEVEAIERTRRLYGFKTRAEAVRFLIRKAARPNPRWQDDPLFNFRIEGYVEPGEDLTSEQINRGLYGWD